MNIFAQLKKFDESTGYFEAVAADESLDHENEIFDFERSAPNFLKWSETVSNVTQGKSVGNVREMHGKVAAGKLTRLECDADNKQIRVAGIAVDPVSREKLASGVLTGVSIGGNYGKTWEDTVIKGAKRYEAIPTEISLVDYPANPNAFFTVVKSDGAEELRKFDKVAERKDVDPKEGKDKYGDVDFADEKNKKYPIDTAAHIRAAWNYIHKPKNAAKYSAEDVKTIKAKIVAAWKKKIDPKGPPEAEKFASTAERLSKNAAATDMANTLSILVGNDPVVEKGLWTVSQFACLLEQLSAILECSEAEAAQEGDDSEVPANLKAALKPLADAFIAMAGEEANEAVGTDAQPLAAAASTSMQKRGAKHSAETKNHYAEMRKHHQAMGEHLDALQGTDDDDDADDDDGDDGDADAKKSIRAALKKSEEARAALQQQLIALCDQVTKLLGEPRPMKGVLRVVSKDGGKPEADDAPVLRADGTQDVEATTMKLMKTALSRPILHK